MSGNTILITGGTSGIGLGLALRLHAADNKVVIAGRRKELLDRISTEHPGIEAIALDLADPASIARAREEVTATHPELNVLVNNAGIMLRENFFEQASLPIAESHITVNLLGTIRMTYAFLPLLADNAEPVVMNVSSALAFVPMPITPTYSATKAALHSFSESLRVQAADAGVQVIEMAPPNVRTPLLDGFDNGQSMSVEEFLDQSLAILRADPEAKEIVVENARFLRNAEANRTYNDILAMFSSQ